MKKWFYLLAALLVLTFFYGCKSEPKAEPSVTEEPVEAPQAVVTEPEPAPEPEPAAPEEPKVEPVSAEELQQAQDAIARAEGANASQFAPLLLKEAKDDLAQAQALKESDPTKAREYIKSSAEKASQAHDEALTRAEESYEARIGKAMDKLKSQKADVYAPQDYAALTTALEEAKQYLAQGEYQKAKESADQLLKDINALNEKLDEKIRWVGILTRDTDQYLKNSNTVEAYIWAPEELEQATILYFQGLDAYRNNDLDKSAQLLEQARKLALTAYRESPKRKAQYGTKALMDEVKKEIEAASELTTISEDGSIIKPRQWSGEEEPQTEPTDGEQGKDDTSAVSSAVRVLGDESSENLLDKAKELWKKGVSEKAKGNLEQANEYFETAGRLVWAYKYRAVASTFVVRRLKIPDTLWNIAKTVYDNPFLWPTLWVANSVRIKDPDLIFPGQELAIPAR